MENFIRVYKNAYSAEYCNEVIEYFEKLIAAGFGRTRKELENISRRLKDDISFHVTEQGFNKSFDFSTVDVSIPFFNIFWEQYYPDYVSNFPILEDYGRHTVYKIKVQKTIPGGGYHVWHSEVANKEYNHRIAAFTLYLNDIEEGGETEFLYQGLRIKPEQGTLVIWPSGYTHTHRGNPPLKETKYILTGWIEFE